MKLSTLDDDGHIRLVGLEMLITMSGQILFMTLRSVPRGLIEVKKISGIFHLRSQEKLFNILETRKMGNFINNNYYKFTV